MVDTPLSRPRRVASRADAGAGVQVLPGRIRETSGESACGVDGRRTGDAEIEVAAMERRCVPPSICGDRAARPVRQEDLSTTTVQPGPHPRNEFRTRVFGRPCEIYVTNWVEHGADRAASCTDDGHLPVREGWPVDPPTPDAGVAPIVIGCIGGW